MVILDQPFGLHRKERREHLRKEVVITLNHYG